MRRAFSFCIFVFFLSLLAGPCPAQQAGTLLKTRNVVLIVSDGLRWQEVFTGAEKDLITTDHGGNWASKDYLAKTWWRDKPEERRKAVFPFLWTTIATRGQIFGNQGKGSIAHVTNPYSFSYPGYNEMLTGAPDARIDSNEFGPNPNVTVFEWLNAQPAFHGQVSVFATWEVFNDIFNVSRSHLPVHCGWTPPYPTDTKDPRQQLLNELYRTTTKLEDNDTYNSFLQIPLLDYLKKEHPRVVFVGYGETDNWAHSGRYDLVLESAHNFDHLVGELWNFLQSLPEYKDQTTFILTADHGRGSGPEQWKEHGADEKGSDNIWIAVIGPDTQPLGERTNIPPVTQSQIAATLAALLGQNYNAVAPQAGKPIADVLPQ
jgi:hypothetical protein